MSQAAAAWQHFDSPAPRRLNSALRLNSPLYLYIPTSLDPRWHNPESPWTAKAAPWLDLVDQYSLHHSGTQCHALQGMGDVVQQGGCPWTKEAKGHFPEPETHLPKATATDSNPAPKAAGLPCICMHPENWVSPLPLLLLLKSKVHTLQRLRANCLWQLPVT